LEEVEALVNVDKPVTPSVPVRVELPVTPSVPDKVEFPFTVRLPPTEARLVISKLLETLALVNAAREEVMLFKLSMFLLFPVTSPPRVKALMVRVPELSDLITLEPPPLKEITPLTAVAVRLEPLNPLTASIDPENVLEAVLLEVITPPRVRVPDMLAVPPTSRVVLITFPALMPSRELVPVNSRLPEILALLLRVNCPETEAVPSTSRLVETLAELLNTQNPVMV
jgi:hypothetical protein